MSTQETKETKNYNLKTNKGLMNSLIGYLRANKAEAKIGVIMTILVKAFIERMEPKDRDSLKYDEENPLGSFVSYLKKYKGVKNGDLIELGTEKTVNADAMLFSISLDRKPNSSHIFLVSANVSDENLTIEYGKGENLREKDDDEKVIRNGASYLIFRNGDGVIEHLYLQKENNFQYFGNGKPREDRPTEKRPPRAEHKDRGSSADSAVPKFKKTTEKSTTDQSALIQVLLEQNRKLMEIVENSVGSSKSKGSAKR